MKTEEKIKYQGSFPAFPSDGGVGTALGLTKREYIAIQAMNAILTNSAISTYDLSRNTEDICGDVVNSSIRMADEMLKQF